MKVVRFPDFRLKGPIRVKRVCGRFKVSRFLRGGYILAAAGLSNRVTPGTRNPSESWTLNLMRPSTVESPRFLDNSSFRKAGTWANFGQSESCVTHRRLEPRNVGSESLTAFSLKSGVRA